MKNQRILEKFLIFTIDREIKVAKNKCDSIVANRKPQGLPDGQLSKGAFQQNVFFDKSEKGRSLLDS